MKSLRRIWGAFLALGIVYAIGAATRAGVPGMVLASLQTQFAWTASQVALVSSFGVFGCMVFLPLAGWAIDRVGWLRVACLGVLLQALGGFGMACGSVGWIYPGAFVNGGGRTIIYLAIFKLLDVEFARRFFALFVGLFYLFSYGGTWVGAWAFARFEPWQKLVQGSNLVLIVMGLCLLIVRATGISKKQPSAVFKIQHTEKLVTLRSVFALCATSLSILIYWTFLTVGARPYLNAFYGGNLAPLFCMNTLVVIGMVGGGPFSFALGNHRRTFQIVGVGSLLVALVSLACGGVWVGFVCLGVGYGMTAIQICALRESVPSAYSARTLALANFLANLGIIFLSQLITVFYDS